MSTITREQLRERARAKVKSLEFSITQTAFADSRAELEEELELARIALVSLEADPSVNHEPVAWQYKEYVYVSGLGYLWREKLDCEFPGADCETLQDVVPLYAAPPAPVSMKDHQIRELVNELRDIAVEYHCTQQLRERIARTVRAAMLQGAESRPELTVWYGAMPETNGKTNWTAMLHRKCHHPWEGITIDRSEYPDRVRYEADRMRHLIGELADEPDILAYDAEAHSGYVYPGNSPVIPDGWVACSERMPHIGVPVITCCGDVVQYAAYAWDGKEWQDWYEEYDKLPANTFTHWHPRPAAPQQEVK